MVVVQQNDATFGFSGVKRRLIQSLKAFLRAPVCTPAQMAWL